MANQKTSNVAICPECDGTVRLTQKLQVGQILSCHRCDSTLVITDRRPLELILENSYLPLNNNPKINKTNAKRNAAFQSSNQQIDEVKEDPFMPTKSRVSMVDCPECDSKIRFRQPLKVGQLVVCPECDETLEVLSLRPLELSWADDDPWDPEDYDDHRYDIRY